eukprot:scaffold267746_cov18-Tisochrysis_lutea.AAC.1
MQGILKALQSAERGLPHLSRCLETLPGLAGTSKQPARKGGTKECELVYAAVEAQAMAPIGR